MQRPFPDRLRLPLDFDPRRLTAAMAAIEDGGWIAHFVRQNYEGDWSVIPLRGPAGASHQVRMIYSDPTCTYFADTPVLAAAPYFREVLAAFACPLQAVRLMRLTPGSVIKEHTDLDLAFEQGTVRIHIPMTTNDGVDFRLNGGALRDAGGFRQVPAAVRPAQPGPHGDRRQGQRLAGGPVPAGPDAPARLSGRAPGTRARGARNGGLSMDSEALFC